MYQIIVSAFHAGWHNSGVRHRLRVELVIYLNIIYLEIYPGRYIGHDTLLGLKRKNNYLSGHPTTSLPLYQDHDSIRDRSLITDRDGVCIMGNVWVRNFFCALLQYGWNFKPPC